MAFIPVYIFQSLNGITLYFYPLFANLYIIYEASAGTWCAGKTQRDPVEREVGGGTRMGNTCKSMANSFQCMTKTNAML